VEKFADTCDKLGDKGEADAARERAKNYRKRAEKNRKTARGYINKANKLLKKGAADWYTGKPYGEEIPADEPEPDGSTRPGSTASGSATSSAVNNSGRGSSENDSGGL